MWTEALWADRPEQVLLGFGGSNGLADVARAVMEGHAYAIRGNLEDLERASGRPSHRVILTGGAATNPWFAQLVADITQRAIQVPVTADVAARATCKLLDGTVTPLASTCVDPQPDPRYEDGYQRFTDGFAAAAHARSRSTGTPAADGKDDA